MNKKKKFLEKRSPMFKSALNNINKKHGKTLNALALSHDEEDSEMFSKETIRRIKQAKKEIREGKVISSEELRRRLEIPAE